MVIVWTTDCHRFLLCHIIWKDKYTDEKYPHSIKILFRWEVNWEDKSKFEKDEISSVERFFPEEIYSMDQNTIRNLNIKKWIELYLKWNNYPLDLIDHRVQI